MSMQAIPVSIVRGGTSKGVFIMQDALPEDAAQRDRIILRLFGSPDIRQIDGLGGADVLTSKLAIIGKSPDGLADVDYTFAQVSITEPFVDYGGNCGNISAAVAGFAIDHGLVQAHAPQTTVRIRLKNTGRILIATVPVQDGRAAISGDYAIDGVPGTGAKILLDWQGVAGGVTGKLLPTGNAVDCIEAGNRSYRVSVVDAGNVVVFAHAEELDLIGTETPDEIESKRALMERIEELRAKVCVKLGMVQDWRDARTMTPFQPFFALLRKPIAHTCVNGRVLAAGDMDIVSRLVFMQRMHKAYPITGTVATGAALCLPGTIAHALLAPQARGKGRYTIAHPSGLIEVEAATMAGTDGPVITALKVARTARTIMDGTAYIP